MNKVKKLKLFKETLRNLSVNDLSLVEGGDPAPLTGSGISCSCETSAKCQSAWPACN